VPWGPSRTVRATLFHFVMIKPTHYDDDGYPIQWFRSAIPSNTASHGLNGLAERCTAPRKRARRLTSKSAFIPMTKTNRRVSAPDRNRPGYPQGGGQGC